MLLSVTNIIREEEDQMSEKSRSTINQSKAFSRVSASARKEKISEDFTIQTGTLKEPAPKGKKNSFDKKELDLTISDDSISSSNSS